MTEEEILKFWQDKKIFEKSLAKNSPKGEFVFYDGPPFATGLPHYGHLLAGTIKDVIPRYKTMQGYHVRRRWGWDCHGLPVEHLIEKELGLQSRKDIENYGIENFNQKARDSVLRYADEWKKIIERTGRFVDMADDYRTMDADYSETIWWIFKTLYDQGLVYEGHKAMQICPRCETTLSNFEVSQGYKDITDISVTVKFELVDKSGVYVLAWTTTPWTLPGNVALAINAGIKYVKIKIENDENFYILAKDRLSVIKDKYEIIEEFAGKDLVGKKYKPVFDYYINDKNLKNRENGWKIWSADFVTTEDGTGVVHIAPAFGEDDYQLALKENLPFIQHVTMSGEFKPEVKDFAGQKVKPIEDPQATDISVLKHLAGKNLIFAKEKIVHSYPHCWRCSTPLLNYATSSWFVKVTDLKDKLILANNNVSWVPENIKDGRFGKWLEGARDWAISRTRYWGAPIPVWRCDKCSQIKVLGSFAELPELPRNRNSELDVHRPYIDEIKIACSCGGEMVRVPDVFDCWFESGAMPYAQDHYPFEKKNFNPAEKKGWPADFIAEGLDQTRGWFYSLIVLGVALFGESPYRQVVTNGLILAEDGQKMSKSLKNYPDIMAVIDKYGVDALRFYLLNAPVVRGEDLNFSEKGVMEIQRKIIARLLNVHTFFETYTDEKNKTGFDVTRVINVLDKWILLRLDETIKRASGALDKYEIDRATRSLDEFIDDLSTWYLRRSRERFKTDGEDKEQVLIVTRFVLREMSKLLAPLTPFVSEMIYQKVKDENEPESAHLTNWPDSIFALNNSASDNWSKVLTDMVETRRLVSLGLEARQKLGLNVRQPLAEFKVKNCSLIGREEYLKLIRDELNVKKISFDQNLETEIWLDPVQTSELKAEGEMREMVRLIQDQRKKSGLTPGQTVVAEVSTTKDGREIFKKFEKEIKEAANLREIRHQTLPEGQDEIPHIHFVV